VANGPRIRANSVLPARREPLELRTTDGLRLVGELALPAHGDPAATIICLHPLPTAGGMMDSQIFRKAAYRLPALAAVGVLRFNTRGTASAHGRSEGEFGGGVAEQYDLAAALRYAESAGLPHRWLVGWSFGTDLVLMYGAAAPVEGAVLLSPPLRLATDADLRTWAETGKPLVAIVPEHDDYLRPTEARERFSGVPQAEVVAVPGGRHLWVGQAETVLDLIAARVNPDAAPLATEWHGEMTLAAPTIVPNA
jgi:alpha/beta superfamily hydrolase